MKKGHERDERHWEQKDKHNKKQVEKFQFQLFCVKTCIIYVVLRKFLRVGFAYLYFFFVTLCGNCIFVFFAGSYHYLHKTWKHFFLFFSF